MNQYIIHTLETEIKELETNNGNKYKISSLKNAVKVIKKLSYVITDVKQLKDIKGIGEGILKRIDKALQSYNDTNNNLHEEYAMLENLIGFGSKKVSELNELGIYTPEQLHDSFIKNEIKLTHNQQLGLKYAVGRVKYQDKIPRVEVSFIINQLSDLIDLHDDKFEIIPCGSYRRQKEFSNDIDILLLHPSYVSSTDSTSVFPFLLNHLINHDFLIDHLTSNISKLEHKYMGLIRSTHPQFVRRLDFHFVCQQSKYAAMLYFTGSASLNRQMRQIAKNQGYKLNEKCIIKENTCITINSEKDIFDILGMPYLAPQDR